MCGSKNDMGSGESLLYQDKRNRMKNQPDAGCVHTLCNYWNLLVSLMIACYILDNNTRQGYAHLSTLKPAGCFFGESGSGFLSHAL